MARAKYSPEPGFHIPGFKQHWAQAWGQKLNVNVTQALGKIVRRATADAFWLDTVNVAGVNHTDVPRIKPGSEEYLALATFLREGGPGQLDVVSPIPGSPLRD